MHTLCEFNTFTKFLLERLMEEVGDRRLSAVIIDLNGFNIKQVHSMRGYKAHKLALESFHNLPKIVDAFLVDAQAMVAERHLLRERHHTREYASAPFAAHELVPLFLPNQRTSVKTMPFKTDLIFRPLQVGDIVVDGPWLVVQHQTKDIKARIRIGELEAPRFIYEYAQHLTHALK